MSRFNKKTKRQIHKSIENPSGVVHLRHLHGNETLCGYPYEYATKHNEWKLTQKPASCKKCLRSTSIRYLPQPYYITTPPQAKTSHYIHIKSSTGKVHATNCMASAFGAYGPERFIAVCGSANYQSGVGMWRKWSETDAPVTCKHCIKQMGCYPHKEEIGYQIIYKRFNHSAQAGAGNMAIFTNQKEAKLWIKVMLRQPENFFRIRKVKIIYLED